MKPSKLLAAALIASGAFVATAAVAASHEQPHCSSDNGGIQLPKGFCAVVVADHLGTARHLAVAKNGDIYVALRKSGHGGGIAALRDTNGDGKADTIKHFAKRTGTGIAIHDGWLYFAPTTEVLRYQLEKGQLVPGGSPQKIASLPNQNEHSARGIAFDDDGHVYVNIGAPSNSCQKQDRAPHSPGMKPCPLLKHHGGIWRFNADQKNQSQSDGKRFATGTRNVIALAWNASDDQLYGVQMGRDQLHELWPKKFTTSQSAELPGEEFLHITEGDNFGWPYCYYDQTKEKRMLDPEYGGDGKKTGKCGQYKKPMMAFPGHWAPEALLFYTGKQFPKHYRGGAFIAFHGSWNRSPEPQKGYKVVFVPFKHGKPSGKYKTFADGFKGKKKLTSPKDARFRPNGLAQGPDGSLYIADSQQGRIWRVIYTGDREGK
jgi:glucose/arabinose dehydrogenase